MKKHRGKKSLAFVEKRAWQRKFIKAQGPILSDFAYSSYKEYGVPGVIWIKLNDCMPLIIPGANIPRLNYVCELNLDPRASTTEGWLEKLKQYDPEKQYFLAFQFYTVDPPFAKLWTLDLKFLSDKEYYKKYAFAFALDSFIDNEGFVTAGWEPPIKH
jgi:hypothetical protein